MIIGSRLMPSLCQSTDRSDDRMQRAQSADSTRHAGLRLDHRPRQIAGCPACRNGYDGRPLLPRRISVSSRDHQPCRVAVLPVRIRESGRETPYRPLPAPTRLWRGIQYFYPYYRAMTTGNGLERHLLRLDLLLAEAAQLLRMIPHTVRCWLDGEEVSGPAEQAVRAWIGLRDRRLPWQPHGAA
jgi:hypothetical protein